MTMTAVEQRLNEDQILAEAMLKVQQQLKPVLKSAENPYFKSRYADLATVWESCIKILNDNSFAVLQPTKFVNENFVLQTTLLHSCGARITGDYWLNPAKPNDPQALAAAVTYARRNALCALIGLVADEDDDGNKASGREHPEISMPSQKATTHQDSSKPKEDALQGQDHPVSGEFATVKFTDIADKSGISKKTGNPYKKFILKGSDGKDYSTFDQAVYDQANAAGVDQEWSVQYETNQYGRLIKAINEV